jgi:putative phosphoesterase
MTLEQLTDRERIVRAAFETAERVGVVSDNHRNEAAVTAAVAKLHEYQVQAVIHLGDVKKKKLLQSFADFPMAVVFGNNDSPRKLGPVAEQHGILWHEEGLMLQMGPHRVWCTHGHLRLVPPDGCRHVFSAHTHIPADYTRGGIRHCNPGALYRAQRWTIGIFYPEVDTFTLVEIPRSLGIE